MTKLQFLMALRERLSGLPSDEIEERLRFYSEMIEDRMEEGISEEEAVRAVGSIDEIAAQLEPPSKTKMKRQLKGWEIAFLVLTAPIWLSVLLSVVSVVFSAGVSLWAAVISLWAVFGSVVAAAFSCILMGIGSAFDTHGIAVFCGGLVCTGVSIFLFFVCSLATKWLWLLTKKVIEGGKALCRKL
ncbi:MAG: DUF1700 domain-containing protein [Ruminococcaceae bacterium]|nr:DUF1700 domain-containing protein [Oscillospiraceae bacterium]